MMAAVPGFTYSELREMPLPELYAVREEVARIAKKRADASSKAGAFKSPRRR